MSDEQTAAPWDAWYERACSMTLADLPAFINEMAEAGTDYNTTAEATGAAAVAAAWALAHTFGLTGFQGGWIMWQFMRHWNGVGEDGPARLLNYGDLLYPQMEEKFRALCAYRVDQGAGGDVPCALKTGEEHGAAATATSL